MKTTPTDQMFEQHVARDFDRHMKFIKKLESSVDESKTKQLLNVYTDAARQYHDKAVELICQESNNLDDCLTAHSKVMERIRQHDTLLSQLSQPYPPVSLDSIRDLLRTVIQFLSVQLVLDDRTVPFLKPVIGSDFSYIHFNYANNAMGIVTVPMEFCVLPADEQEDWSVIWHEVAGYAIATRHEKVNEWANALKGSLKSENDSVLWTAYQRAFTHSYSNTLKRRLDKCLTSITTDMIREDLEANVIDWETDWLGEFLEDLFFVRVFVTKNHMPESSCSVDDSEKRASIDQLVDGLRRTYPDPKSGDQIHPSPNLRVLVALAYLHQAFDENSFGSVLKRYIGVRDSYNLKQVPQDYQRLALQIAEFCNEKLDQLYEPVSQTEIQLARFALGLPTSIEQILAEMAKEATTFVPPPEVRLANAFVSEINESSLDRLLDLRFIDKDPDRFGPPFYT